MGERAEKESGKRSLSVGEVRGGKCDAEMKESLKTGLMTASVIAYSL